MDLVTRSCRHNDNEEEAGGLAKDGGSLCSFSLCFQDFCGAKKKERKRSATL